MPSSYYTIAQMYAAQVELALFWRKVFWGF